MERRIAVSVAKHAFVLSNAICIGDAAQNILHHARVWEFYRDCATDIAYSIDIDRTRIYEAKAAQGGLCGSNVP